LTHIQCWRPQGYRRRHAHRISILKHTVVLVDAMSDELKVDGLELLAMSEDAPEQVEAIIELMIEADEELFADDEQE
jgi:hypothetical protein